MLYDRKLSEWQRHGLIDAETAAKIRAYESDGQRPVLLYAVAGLGALTIALGVLAIVASNWEAIPGGLKLAVDLAFACGIAAAILKTSRPWLREALIGLYYGFVLASIGLIAQVYHLGGATWQAISAWSALTFVLMTRSQSRGLATAWLLGLQVTFALCVGALIEGLPGDEAIAYGVFPLAALLPLVVCTFDQVQKARPRLVAAFAGLAWTELAWAASGATLLFYENPFRDGERGGLVIGAALAAALVALLCARAGRLVGARREAITPLRVVLVSALAIGYLPPLLGVDDQNLVGALAFLGLWAAIAWLAHASHHRRLLNTATALIGLRLLIIYFEVFGSLLSTGLGLISGGLLTLGIAYAWAQKRRDFAAELGDPPAPSSPGSEHPQ